MIAVAVPIKDSPGRMVAALACHAPAVRMTLNAVKTHPPIMKQAAEQLRTEAEERTTTPQID